VGPPKHARARRGLIRRKGPPPKHARARQAAHRSAVGRPRGSPSDRETLIRHAKCLAAVAGVSVVLLRSFFGPGIPAGTDALGFIARANENAQGGIGSAWAPSSFGSPRTFTLEQLLGLLTMLTRNPVLTYKVAAFALIFASGVFTYALTWRWYKSHAAGVLAGVLYAVSPIALAQWASGHLNVEVAIALLPLQLLLWDVALERARLRVALGLGLSFALLLLSRPDMIALSVVALGVYLVNSLISRRGAASTLRNATFTLAVAGLSALCLDAYQLVPAIAGVRSEWLSYGSLFDVQQLIDHSLPAYQSLARFAQETGYLGYSRLPSSFGHPWLPYGVYVAVSLCLPILAALILVWRRDLRTGYLLCLAALATFVAKGVRPPLDSPYAMAIEVLNPLKNLRTPNRWLVLQALALSVLAAVSVVLIASAARRVMRSRWTAIWLPRLTAATLAAMLLLPVMPVLRTGLLTYRLDAGEQRLVDAVRAGRGEFMVASVPYSQPYRFVERGAYRGYEHDLGSESSLFTGHPAVGAGDWNPRASSFVAYTAELLDRGDPAFGRLLGASNTRYVMSFRYPAISKSFSTNAIGQPNLSLDPFAQTVKVRSMPALRPLLSTSAGAVLATPNYAPVITVRPNIATILGGSSGLAMLASTPGLEVSRWAPTTAGDALDMGGLPELSRALSRSKLAYMVDTTVDDLALATVPPTARLDGLLSAPARKIGPGALARTGQLVTSADDDSSERASAVSVRFNVVTRQRSEVWVRVQMSPTPARLRATLDGLASRSVLPLSSATHGFRWIRIWSGPIGVGDHRLTLTSEPSDFGQDANVTQALVVGTSARSTSQAEVRSLVEGASHKLAYAIDPAFRGAVMAPAAILRNARAVSVDAKRFWHVVDPAQFRTGGVATRHGADGLLLKSPGNRSFFTLAMHHFAKPRDWSRYRYLLIDFFGRATGQRLEANVFEVDDEQRFTFPFVDDKRGWRTLAIHIPDDGGVVSGTLDWSRIGTLKIGAKSKSERVSFGLGNVRLAVDPPTHPLSFEVAPAITTRRLSVSPGAARGCPGTPDAVTVAANSRQVRTKVPLAWVRSHCRLVVREVETPREAPLVPTDVTRLGRTKYQVAFESTQPSMLTFSRTFDRRWNLSTGGPSVQHVPVSALANGYILEPGVHTATLEFSGDRLVPFGAAVSLASVLLLILVMLGSKTNEVPVAAATPPARNGRLRIGRRLSGSVLTVSQRWCLSGLLLVAGAVALFAGEGFAGQLMVGTAILLMPLTWKGALVVSLAALVEVGMAAAIGHYMLADICAVVAVLALARIGFRLVVSGAHQEPDRDAANAAAPSQTIVPPRTYVVIPARRPRDDSSPRDGNDEPGSIKVKVLQA
jgi:hypothetical protein